MPAAFSALIQVSSNIIDGFIQYCDVSHEFISLIGTLHVVIIM